jgi:hypothetical protein
MTTTLLRIMLTMKMLISMCLEASHGGTKSKYRCTNHVLTTTSRVVECLFNRAKLFLCDKRRGMTPRLVEMLLFGTVTKIFGLMQMFTSAQ